MSEGGVLREMQESMFEDIPDASQTWALQRAPPEISQRVDCLCNCWLPLDDSSNKREATEIQRQLVLWVALIYSNKDAKRSFSGSWAKFILEMA